MVCFGVLVVVVGGVACWFMLLILLFVFCLIAGSCVGLWCDLDGSFVFACVDGGGWFVYV